MNFEELINRELAIIETKANKFLNILSEHNIKVKKHVWLGQNILIIDTTPAGKIKALPIAKEFATEHNLNCVMENNNNKSRFSLVF